MKHLLLFLGAVLALAPAASAQWTFDGFFPSDTSLTTPQNHGLAVDAEGRVWTQSYYPFTGDSVYVDPLPEVATGCNTTTQMCRVTALHVFNPDGSPAAFSPISIIELPGGEVDTLGGGVIINSSNQTAWDYNSGRGLRADPDGNIIAVQFNTIYKFSPAGEVLAVAEPTIFDPRGLVAPGVDDAGNIYITGVFPGDPIAILSSDLEYVSNVTDAVGGFNRSLLTLPDGNTVFALNYSADVATVYQRADEFSDWDSTGAAFRGMSVESAAIHPVTGNIWVSAGSANDVPTAPWQWDTWYEFTVQDALANEIPTPLDSIVWANQPDPGGATAFRPRAIAFSADGMTAYVGSFNRSEPSIQRFVYSGVAVEPSGTGVPESFGLAQNYPNPFRSSTRIAFDLPQSGHAALRVYDVLGREVATLVDEALGADSYTATFEAKGLAPGTYLYVLELDGRRISTNRMTLTK